MMPADVGRDRPALASTSASTAGPWLEKLRDTLDVAADGWRVLTRHLDDPPPVARFIIEIGRETTRLIDATTPPAPVTLAKSQTRDASQIAAQAASAIARLNVPANAIALGFTDDIALDVTIALPKASRRLLDQAVAARIATESPYAAGEGLAFWQLHRTAGDSTRAQISIVPMHTIAPILAALTALDVTPTLAMRATQPNSWATSPSWLLAPLVSKPPRWSQLTSLPRAARLALLCTTLIIGSALANWAVTSLRVASLSGAAEQANEVAKQSSRRDADAALLAGRQRDALLKLQILNTLAERLPDGSWFERLDLKDDKLELIGYAPSAADTLRIIAGITGVRSAEILSAITRDQTRNIERFRLGAQIGNGPAAKPTPATQPTQAAKP
jgi:general secretion pathway protein L